VDDDCRVLVTNHEVFGYFTERYDFEVIGTVIPSITTNADASIAEIEELAELIDAEGVPAIFDESSSSAQLAEALAEGDVEVSSCSPRASARTAPAPRPGEGDTCLTSKTCSTPSTGTVVWPPC